MAYLSFQLRRGKVASLRKAHLLSQVDLAEKAHLSEATIVRVEKGRRVGRTTLVSLASALECDPLELVA